MPWGYGKAYSSATPPSLSPAKETSKFDSAQQLEFPSHVLVLLLEHSENKAFPNPSSGQEHEPQVHENPNKSTQASHQTWMGSGEGDGQVRWELSPAK